MKRHLLGRFGFTAGAATAVLAACATAGHERPPSIGVAELVEEGQVLRVRVDSHYFEPDRLVVKVGVPVHLILESGTLLADHSFTLFAPEAGIELNAYVPARRRVTVEFLPRALGELPFRCGVDDHADRGMVGVLEVVERLPGEVVRDG